jgi:hypothetical protein
MLRKAHAEGTDIYTALLEYKSTPIKDSNRSLAQLLMSWNLRTKLPISKCLLEPKVETQITDALRLKQCRQKKFYDRSARTLPQLQIGESCRIRRGDTWEKAIDKGIHE